MIDFYSMPYVCLDCCRSFKRPGGLMPPARRPCPVCGKPAIGLHPNFKAPPESKIKQWELVRYLVEKGFRFQSLWDRKTETVVPYPTSMKEAIPWVERWKDEHPGRGGPGEIGITPGEFSRV